MCFYAFLYAHFYLHILMSRKNMWRMHGEVERNFKIYFPFMLRLPRTQNSHLNEIFLSEWWKLNFHSAKMFFTQKSGKRIELNFFKPGGWILNQITRFFRKNIKIFNRIAKSALVAWKLMKFVMNYVGHIFKFI